MRIPHLNPRHVVKLPTLPMPCCFVPARKLQLGRVMYAYSRLSVEGQSMMISEMVFGLLARDRYLLRWPEFEYQFVMTIMSFSPTTQDVAPVGSSNSTSKGTTIVEINSCKRKVEETSLSFPSPPPQYLQQISFLSCGSRSGWFVGVGV